MPTTPQFGIAYPCMSPTITPADFARLATTTEVALDAVGFSVLTPGSGEAYNVTHVAWGRGLGGAAPAPGAEGTFLFNVFPLNTTFGGGITIFPALGTFVVTAGGFYDASVSIGGNSSTLTMTSQRVAVYVNGNLYAAKKTRGSNPVSAATLSSSYDFGVNLTAGDTVTFRYLWTGTGAIGLATATCSLSLLSRT